MQERLQELFKTFLEKLKILEPLFLKLRPQTPFEWGILASSVAAFILVIAALIWFFGGEEPQEVLEEIPVPKVYELGSTVTLQSWPDPRYKSKKDEKPVSLSILIVNVPLTQEAIDLLEKSGVKDFGCTLNLQTFSPKEDADLLKVFKSTFSHTYCPLIFEDPFAQVETPKNLSLKLPLSPEMLAEKLRDVFWHLSADPRKCEGFVLLNSAAAISSLKDYDCLRLDSYMKKKPILSLGNPLVKLSHITDPMTIFYADAFIKTPLDSYDDVFKKIEELSHGTGKALVAFCYHPSILDVFSKWALTLESKNITLIPPHMILDN